VVVAEKWILVMVKPIKIDNSFWSQDKNQVIVALPDSVSYRLI